MQSDSDEALKSKLKERWQQRRLRVGSAETSSEGAFCILKQSCQVPKQFPVKVNGVETAVVPFMAGQTLAYSLIQSK